MRQFIILIALLALWPGYVHAQINQDTVNSDVPGGGGSGGGGLTESDINTPAKLNAFVTPDLADISSSQTFTNKTVDAAANTIKILKGADCTAFDAAVDGQYCWDTDDDLLYVCETADVCDTSDEWDAVASTSTPSVQSIVIADSGDGNAAVDDDTEITSTIVEVMCQDSDGCDLLLSNTNAVVGQQVTIIQDMNGEATTVTGQVAGTPVLAATCSGAGAELPAGGTSGARSSVNFYFEETLWQEECITNPILGSVPLADALSATPDPCDTASKKMTGIQANGAAICDQIDADEVVFDKTGTNFTSSEVDSAIKEFGTVDATGPNGDDWLVDYSRLNNVPAFAVPSGTNPTVSGAGDLAIDTTDQQLVYYGGSSAVVLTGQNSKCIVVEQIKAADDNMMIASWPDAVTINSVWCQYNGSAPSTAATFTLEDGGGNAMTITGTNPTCTAPGTPPTPAAVTANNTLTAYELLRFDTTNTPDPATDTYLICVGLVYDRQ